MSAQPTSIYQLWKDGALDQFEQLGILRPTIIPYCKMYEEYARHRAAGLNFMAACEITAEQLSTSPETVRRAIGQVI